MEARLCDNEKHLLAVAAREPADRAGEIEIEDLRQPFGFMERPAFEQGAEEGHRFELLVHLQFI